MRIGCLQFAPQVGDVDNNLNRADAVLSKAGLENLDELDLLVLPELAFTGYNFKSLQQISPFLEPSGSGISALWARTTALKYNCAVCVGYPEKVDPTLKWPTSPEYYNAALIVNSEGETVVNYRKRFLYSVDETWALEGNDGFFHGKVPGLGWTSVGICMDLNPYKFEAPWHAYEFAFDVLEAESNLVVVSMAWLTQEDGRQFSRMPQEPDMDTLTYWVSRLEPLIRAEREEEIIVVFCNRTGVEDEIYYAGTSAVVGIKGGEVNVYGLLGRGVKELLIVDTETPPLAKLVYRPDRSYAVSAPRVAQHELPPHSDSQNTERSPKTDNSHHRPSDSPAASGSGPGDEADSGYPESASRIHKLVEKSRSLPKITIPPPSPATNWSRQGKHVTPIADESPIIPTPTAPSPTPLSKRPKFDFPQTQASKTNDWVSGSDYAGKSPGQVLGGNRAVSTDHIAPHSPSNTVEPLSAKFFWVPPRQLLQTPPESGWTPHQPQPPTVPIDLTKAYDKVQDKIVGGLRSGARENSTGSSPLQNATLSSGTPKAHQSASRASRRQETIRQEVSRQDESPNRPSSPKSRNASRNRLERHHSESSYEGQDMVDVGKKLDILAKRPGSAMDAFYSSRGLETGAEYDRPRSPASRNANRSADHGWNRSQASIRIAASPSVFEADLQSSQESLLRQARSRFSQQYSSGVVADDISPHSGIGSTSQADLELDRPRSRSASQLNQAKVLESRRPQSRTENRTRAPSIPTGTAHLTQSRNMSRGRQREVPYSPPSRTHSSGLRSNQGQVEWKGAPADFRSNSRPANKDDEIIAIVEFGSSGCHVVPVDTPSQSVDPEQLATEARISHGHQLHIGTEQSPDAFAANGTKKTAVSAVIKDPGDGVGVDLYPATSGSSVETLATPRDSPATPKTPKAMVCIPDYDHGTPDTDLSAAMVDHKILALKSRLKDMGLNVRPRSAVL